MSIFDCCEVYVLKILFVEDGASSGSANLELICSYVVAVVFFAFGFGFGKTGED